uniref:Bowman-Birk type proteinase inhibitor B5 n=1 Tax=Hyacinthus orientalis TaxID=82025 RepID=IBBB5_HYAOR|nr:RecName: Full=Bowman-Birk type proteinase inhibitor B5; Short=HOSPI-B5 [Hyacinthus orientalis]
GRRPCCNECGICDRSLDPMCICEDLVPQCHEGCQACEEVDTGTPMYQCRSFEYYHCGTPCL